MDPPDTTENHFRTDNLTSVSNFYQHDFRTDNLTSVSNFYQHHFRTDNLTSVSNFYQHDFRMDNLSSGSRFYQHDFTGQERIPTHSLWSVLRINTKDKSQTELESGPKDQLSRVVGEFLLSSFACFFFLSRFLLLK